MRILILAILFSPFRPLAGQACGAARYLTDAALHRRWAVVADCSHPERPWKLEDAPWQEPKAGNLPEGRSLGRPAEAKMLSPVRTPAAVTSGMTVRLWREADGARIQLAGVALDAGNAGQMIRVRTGAHGTVLKGWVRGPGSVELSEAGKWQDKTPAGWDQ